MSTFPSPFVSPDNVDTNPSSVIIDIAGYDAGSKTVSLVQSGAHVAVSFATALNKSDEVPPHPATILNVSVARVPSPSKPSVLIMLMLTLLPV